MGDYGKAGLWLLLALSLLAAVAVAAASMWLADRTLPKPVSAGHNGALSAFMTCVGLVYGALLGFVIVVAWEQFSSAEAKSPTRRPPSSQCTDKPLACLFRSRSKCGHSYATTPRQ